MSFVAFGGDDAVRPTFFELIAADRLVPSLKAALVYSLSVYAQRRPAYCRLLDWEDELFALVSLLLDRQSLWSSDATFAESLYGLKRVPWPSQGDSSKSKLTNRQRRETLLLGVCLPYIKNKLEALFQRHRQRTTGPLGLTVVRQPHTQESSRSSAGDRSVLQELRQKALQLFVRIYPWLHASTEGLALVYQLLYLVERTQHYTPLLHFLRLKVSRVSGQELAEQQREMHQRRSSSLTRARDNSTPLRRWLSESWLRTTYLLTDHTRTTLIMAVFGFKLLEWWFTTAEQRLGGQKALPPPPPPPAPKPHPSGVPLPLDVSLCPLCCRKRTNPAMLTSSGYIFCYPCIFNYVTDQHRCPITWLAASTEGIRRLYQLS